MTARTPISATPAVDRRALLRSAAWTVPAVTLAGTAPAFASSTEADAPPNSGGAVTNPACHDIVHRLDWDRTSWGYAPARNGFDGVGTIVAKPDEHFEVGTRVDPLVVTVTNTFIGNMRPRAEENANGAGNMRVAPHVVGGTNRDGLELWQVLTSNNSRDAARVHDDRQTVVFTFDRPVHDLQFTITDIDAHKYRNAAWFQPAQWQYVDNVYLSEKPAQATLGRAVVGGGTFASPWKSSSEPHTRTSSLDNETSSAGNVQVTIAGPVQSFSLTFFNSEHRALAAQGSQAVYLSDLTFRASSCT